MPDLVLDLLKYVFLAILWIFIARAVRAVVMELRPASSAGPSTAAPAVPRSSRKNRAPRKAVVVEGDGVRGKSFDLQGELLIGRSERCHVVIPADSYVSQVHARIFARDENFMIEDLGSTNGTYLNRRRITAPTEVQRGDRVKIGKTVLELRK